MRNFYELIISILCFLGNSIELFQKYGPNARCFETSLDACSHIPACLDTYIVRYIGTGQLAYQIFGHDSK